jgi:tetratricopeptide (TPR) repeat protein
MPMAAEFLVCPACQARNKPKWEFCARCGESLQGVAVQSGGPAPREPEMAEGAGGGLSLAMVLLAVVGLAAGAWAFFSMRGSEAAAKPEPANFNFGTQPPKPAPPPPSNPSAPGQKEFDEGREQLEKGPAKAVTLLAQAVAADPSNARFQNVYAQALWNTGQREQALSHYRTAAQLSPAFRSDLARALDLMGRPTEAMREYQDILATSPGDASTLKEFGSLLSRTRNYAQAVPVLQRAAEAEPGDLYLRQDLAFAQEQGGDLPGAAANYRLILVRAPGSVIARSHLAEILANQGDTDGAIALYREGLAGSTPSALAPALQRGLGSVLERSGRVAEAAAAYREYARLAPNAEDAKEMADRATRLEKQAGGGS